MSILSKILFFWLPSRKPKPTTPKYLSKRTERTKKGKSNGKNKRGMTFEEYLNTQAKMKAQLDALGRK